MSTEVVCVATFRAKPGKANALCKALSALLEPTRGEPGCLNYTLHQSLNNPDVFTMLERFTDKNAFETHRNESYTTHFRENIVSELVEKNSISVEIYKEIG